MYLFNFVICVSILISMFSLILEKQKLVDCYSHKLTMHFHTQLKKTLDKKINRFVFQGAHKCYLNDRVTFKGKVSNSK